MKLNILLILTFAGKGFGQHEPIEENEHTSAAPFHKITFITANSIITNNVTEMSNVIFVIPTFGLNYDYFLIKNGAMDFTMIFYCSNIWWKAIMMKLNWSVKIQLLCVV